MNTLHTCINRVTCSQQHHQPRAPAPAPAPFLLLQNLFSAATAKQKRKVASAGCQLSCPAYGKAVAPPSSLNPALWSRSLLTLAATAAALLLQQPGDAQALLNSPNATIPRTVDAALRRSIPAFNSDVRSIQDDLEAIAFKLRIPQRKPWAAMINDLNAASEIAADDSRMLAGVLPGDEGIAVEILADIRQKLSRLSLAVQAKDPDRTSIRLANTLEYVGQLELLEAPGLPYQVPRQYASMPMLTGRAVVDVTIKAGGNRRPFIDPNSDQGPQKEATLKLVIDGYSAPVTAGNFINRVVKGEYNNIPLSVSDISVIAGSASGGGGGGGQDDQTMPLEILPAGSFEPMYRSTLYVREGELPTLPLSIFGAVAMTHQEGGDAGSVSPTQFFIYKFDKGQSGLSGLSFEEGEFGVFGYLTEGGEALNKVQQGDMIVRAEVKSGGERLINVVE